MPLVYLGMSLNCLLPLMITLNIFTLINWGQILVVMEHLKMAEILTFKKQPTVQPFYKIFLYNAVTF